MEPGGDPRLGYFIAGGLLIALGWGFGVLGNLLVHEWAGSSGRLVGWVHVSSTLGAYAWATLLFGAFTGTFGVVLLFLGRASPKGPIVLPGYPY